MRTRVVIDGKYQWSANEPGTGRLHGGGTFGIHGAAQVGAMIPPPYTKSKSRQKDLDRPRRDRPAEPRPPVVRCGAPLHRRGEVCARTLGHGNYHRSRAAMDVSSGKRRAYVPA